MRVPFFLDQLILVCYAACLSAVLFVPNICFSPSHKSVAHQVSVIGHPETVRIPTRLFSFPMSITNIRRKRVWRHRLCPVIRRSHDRGTRFGEFDFYRRSAQRTLNRLLTGLTTNGQWQWAYMRPVIPNRNAGCVAVHHFYCWVDLAGTPRHTESGSSVCLPVRLNARFLVSSICLIYQHLNPTVAFRATLNSPNAPQKPTSPFHYWTHHSFESIYRGR